jgi:hypothetical protein
MFALFTLLRRWLVMSMVLVAAAGLSGCAGPLKAPTQEQVRQLKSIDVVVMPLPSNFAYRSNGGTVYAQPSVGMSVGTGIGINIAANLIFAGIEYAATATAREAQVPVSKSVEDLDLRNAAVVQLQALLKAGPNGPLLRLSNERFPGSTATGIQISQFAKLAKASEADATLFLYLVPSFRDLHGQTSVTSLSWMVSRSGETLLTTSATFVGPAHPELERAEVVRWWADGRYRRFLGHGLRAAMIPIAEGLLKPLDVAQREAFEYRLKGLPRSQANTAVMTSTPCAVDSDDIRVVYRFERKRPDLLAVAYCPNEALKLPDPDLVPDISWVTEVQPALGAPIAREPAK